MKLNTRARSVYSFLVMAVFALGLQACGGGDSTPVPEPDANPAGYYTGSAAVKTDGDDNIDFAVSDIQIMISGTRIMIMSDAQALLYDGTFTVSGNDLTSTVTIYHNGDKAAATAELTATITEGSQITGTFTGTELGNGTFVSTFSSLNNTVSDTSNLDAYDFESFLNEASTGTSLRFSVFNSGVISPDAEQSTSTFADCVPQTGQFTTISNSSLFTVSITFDSCLNSAVNGTYTGFAQINSPSPTIAITVSNGTNAFADNFEMY